MSSHASFGKIIKCQRIRKCSRTCNSLHVVGYVFSNIVVQGDKTKKELYNDSEKCCQYLLLFMTKHHNAVQIAISIVKPTRCASVSNLFTSERHSTCFYMFRMVFPSNAEMVPQMLRWFLKCWDGSQDSKLPLHASHVALPN